jgi:dihydroneopterin aldolase
LVHDAGAANPQKTLFAKQLQLNTFCGLLQKEKRLLQKF